ncbi:ABC transporter substrate-binding protein [Shinella sp. M31]|uniref:ABC transporter substrate-binding protein n=1 Tax=Shinella sp. M31 TaxID=3368615 RepID=UPI003B9F385A
MAQFGEKLFGEKLLGVNANGEIVPRLATELGSSKDAKTWTFKIREGVTFHDGKSVTAEDVVETMRRTRSRLATRPLPQVEALSRVARHAALPGRC